MEYNEIFAFNSLLMLLILLVVLLAMIIINTKLDIILCSDIKNSDISIKLNIVYMFGLINIKKQIYPVKNNKKKESKKRYSRKKNKKGNYKKINFTTSELRQIYELIRNIKIQELYSDIEFGTEYMQLTSFIYVLANTVYGILANYINSNKMYLSIRPNFTQNYISGYIKVHIEITMKEIIIMFIEILKIAIKNKIKIKGGKQNEGDRFDTKLNGNNA